MFNKYFPAAIAALLSAGLAAAAAAPSEPFSESFEGIQIYPYWTLTQGYGTVALSKDHAYSGSQSLKFASLAGGQRDMVATHTFAQPTKGSVSIAFYDAAPGQETLYEYLTLTNSKNPNQAASVGTRDFDAYCYSAAITDGATGLGPNANCGIYPQITTAPVKRTLGWHVFSIHYDTASVSLAIDGVVVFTTALNFEFDTIQLVVAGPYWRPNTTAYFDNFWFTPL
jgi:hypothetical protein